MSRRRQFFHHPTAALPKANFKKAMKSERVMANSPYEAAFYFVPSRGTHVWLCDLVEHENLLDEAIVYTTARNKLHDALMN